MQRSRRPHDKALRLDGLWRFGVSTISDHASTLRGAVRPGRFRQTFGNAFAAELRQHQR